MEGKVAQNEERNEIKKADAEAKWLMENTTEEGETTEISLCPRIQMSPGPKH